MLHLTRWKLPEKTARVNRLSCKCPMPGTGKRVNILLTVYLALASGRDALYGGRGRNFYPLMDGFIRADSPTVQPMG